MSYNTQSTDGMSVDEIRMKRASLTRELIMLKEEHQKKRAIIEKLDLDNRYLAKDKNELLEELEGKKGKMRALENEILQLESTLVEKVKTKKIALLEMNQMQDKSGDIEARMKSNEHGKEKWQDEMRDMDREIKKLEIQIREM
ncbi:MAG: hypothetical protein UR66_C0002G0005 [Candidatus Moranbacteria bacterium GW2011_GWE1_35_17]|nr:MAG: hypothetical protein UR66_C0002G0005 [Candidatus Moranbacteria bacterium GW2011_GWE1_35_17]KKP84616.1 MAG: hypothetical protein UR83_C0017G0012 [Candidatus Moranbacteria bacterium GW2011_GWF2_35_54]